MLEETGFPYEAHLVSFGSNDQMSPEFLSFNPNNKIPAIIDPKDPCDAPFPLFESGAILIYLAEKSRRFIPQDAAVRYETIQWLMFQMGSIGPMFGQLGFFHKFAGKKYEGKRPRDRYVAESKRLLGVLNARLADRALIMGDTYTIADIATFPWVRNLIGFYEASELVSIADFPQMTRALNAFLARPAVIKGWRFPSEGKGSKENSRSQGLSPCSSRRNKDRKRLMPMKHQAFFPLTLISKCRDEVHILPCPSGLCELNACDSAKHPQFLCQPRQ